MEALRYREASSPATDGEELGFRKQGRHRADGKLEKVKGGDGQRTGHCRLQEIRCAMLTHELEQKSK